MEIEEEYNNRFLQLVGEMQMLMGGLEDSQASVINSALHDFDVDVRKIMKNYTY